jgi:putative transposase
MVSRVALLYLYAYDSVTAARQGLERYVTKYNQQRPNRLLDRKTPAEFYFKNLQALSKAV